MLSFQESLIIVLNGLLTILLSWVCGVQLGDERYIKLDCSLYDGVDMFGDAQAFLFGFNDIDHVCCSGVLWGGLRMV